MADTKKTVQELEKDAVKKITGAKEEVAKAVDKAVETAKPAVEKVKAEGKKTAKATKEKAAKTAKATKEKAAKTATKAKDTAKRVAAAASAAVYVQFNGGEKGVDELVEAAKEDFKANHKRAKIEDLKLYIVPEKSMVYYVVNEDEELKGEFQY
ncbi:MAG: hypothetical protein E7474_00065 [Ruminococcaceae bacterium]|nr:hypothetical protein [Oscillospiraceae bacterium]